MPYLPIQGTSGLNDDWWLPSSPFAQFMRAHQIECVVRHGRSFRWSTDLNWRKWWGGHSDWIAGAEALLYYTDGEAIPLIAHSHGGQVALYAASLGLKTPLLITIGTPVRADMEEIALSALPNIAKWLHISDKKWDLWAHLGALGDGKISLARQMPYPGVINTQVDAIAHSALLKDPAKFPLWVLYDWISLL